MNNPHPKLIAQVTVLLLLLLSHPCSQLLYCFSAEGCRGDHHENLFVLRTLGRSENKVYTKSLPKFTIIGQTGRHDDTTNEKL